ncbi:MAG: hypothetical protein B7733_10095 [Myxococcales bacterium FL481]|nr:MAG: hypothetical protein B7733_10095 [Myxococcales bacterium FL481]
MKHEIRHDLEPDLAKLAATKAVEAYRERFSQYKFSERWVDDAKMAFDFSVAGKTLEGTLAVGASAYELELDVPFVFRVFRGKAVEIIEREVNKWVGKARAGELDEPSASS